MKCQQQSRPHTKRLQLIFFPSVALRKRQNVGVFVVQSSRGCTDSPFSSQLFNIPVNLLHFTSELSSIHHRAYLPSPPSKLPPYNPSYFPLFFPHCWPTNLLHFSIFPGFFPPPQPFTEWSLLLILGEPPSPALSGASACEASARRYALLMGSILCIITPSCLWVQLAQPSPSV